MKDELIALAKEAMSNADLIERLNEPELYYPGNFDTPKRANALLSGLCQEAADALAAADKRIAELERSALVECSDCGKRFMEKVNAIEDLEHKLAVAREELLRCKRIMLHECGIGLVNEVVLAQIGGEDAR